MNNEEVKQALTEVKDTVEDSLQEGKSRDEVIQQIGEKFPGSTVLEESDTGIVGHEVIPEEDYISKDEAVHSNNAPEDMSYELEYPALYSTGEELLSIPEVAEGAKFALLVIANMMLAGYGVGKITKYTIKGIRKLSKK